MCKSLQVEENSTELLEYVDLLITNLDIPDEILSLILQIYSEFPAPLQETILDFILRILKNSPNVCALILINNTNYISFESQRFKRCNVFS